METPERKACAADVEKGQCTADNHATLFKGVPACTAGVSYSFLTLSKCQ